MSAEDTCAITIARINGQWILESFGTELASFQTFAELQRALAPKMAYLAGLTSDQLADIDDDQFREKHDRIEVDASDDDSFPF